MIDEILKANGNLYQTVVPDSGVVLRYRLLSLKEYNLFKKLQMARVLNKYECSMKVFERCFLGETSLLSDNLPAGILISIGDLILWMSGDSDNITLADDLIRHQNMNPNTSVYSYITSAILTVMPGYTIDDLESWDRERLLRIFTIAENILEKQREGYVRLKLEKVDGKKKAKPKHGIDFAAENRALSKHQNPYDIEEAETKLSREQLKKLDNRRR